MTAFLLFSQPVFQRPFGPVEVKGRRQARQNKAEGLSQIEDMYIIEDLQPEQDEEILAQTLADDGDVHRDTDVACASVGAVVDVRQGGKEHPEIGETDHLRPVIDHFRRIVESAYQPRCQQHDDRNRENGKEGGKDRAFFDRFLYPVVVPGTHILGDHGHRSAG